MDKTNALALIRRQRQRWGSREPDSDFARRAARVFFKVAIVYLVAASCFAIVAALGGHRIFYVVAAAWLLGGAYLVFQGRRFTTVLRALSGEQ